MFTGIIEASGVVRKVVQDRKNFNFYVESSISSELHVDQSISHDGICLTVTRVEGAGHWVTAIAETLRRTNAQSWQPGRRINLERCMRSDGRFDGHIVQGHIDQTAVVADITEEGGSWRFTFRYDDSTHVTVEKGSICVNGVSLTCFDSESNSFSVAIIPYTYEHTNFADLRKGDRVNLEFDIIGKYVQRLMGVVR